MIETASGLILRTRPLTETSLIVHWLTPTFGRIATVAKGARRPKSPFLGKLDLFYEAEFTFHRSRRSELHTLREVALRETHAVLRQELGWLQQAAYCARLVEQVSETDTPLIAVYTLMRGLISHLPKQPPQLQTRFAFELKLLGELGLMPDWTNSQLTSGTKRVAGALTTLDWPAVARLKPSDSQVGELRRFLQGFLTFHLGGLPPVRKAASELQ